MMIYRNRRNRIMAFMTAILLVATLHAAAPVSGDANGQVSAERTDLAALVLTPDDLAAEGLAGYGSDYGEWLTMEQVAIGFAAESGKPLEDAIEVYENLGLVQTYSVRIAAATVPGDFNCDATANVALSLVEYQDAAGADLAFNITVANSESNGSVVVDGAETVGDGSFLVRRAEEDDAGDSTAELAIEFHLDRFHGMVTVADVAKYGEPDAPSVPEAALVEALGARQVARIEDGSGSGAASVGLSSIRLMSDEAYVVTAGDRYSAIDGEPLRRFAETEDELAARGEGLQADGMIAIYGLEQDVRLDPADNDPRAAHTTVRLHQFADANAAETWFDDEAYDRFAADPYLDSIDTLDSSMFQDEPRLAAAYTAAYLGFDIDGYVMWVLIDDIVAQITLDAAGGVSAFPLTTLMEEQIACLHAGACAAPVTVPISLLPWIPLRRGYRAARPG